MAMQTREAMLADLDRDRRLWIEGGRGPIREDGGKPTLGEILDHDNETRILRRINAAVLAEREACAKIAENLMSIGDRSAAISAAIRARSKS